MFPSPFRGSYFSILLVITFTKQAATRFRPLPGDLISQFRKGDLWNLQSFLKVSVPFPGILFLNYLWWVQGTAGLLWVSVPFPGILFLNVRTLVRNTELSRVSVPFPGILFLNSLPEIITKTFCIVSVPFPGILFLNHNTFSYPTQIGAFPSPSRGSYFSIIFQR